MSQILFSMSLHLVITVVNSSSTATDVSGHSKQAQQSQVNVIPSYKLKQVLSSLVLSSFATQLSRKEGNTISKLESSKFWNATMVLALKFEWKLGIYYQCPIGIILEIQCMENGRVDIFPHCIDKS